MLRRDQRRERFSTRIERIFVGYNAAAVLIGREPGDGGVLVEQVKDVEEYLEALVAHAHLMLQEQISLRVDRGSPVAAATEVLHGQRVRRIDANFTRHRQAARDVL